MPHDPSVCHNPARSVQRVLLCDIFGLDANPVFEVAPRVSIEIVPDLVSNRAVAVEEKADQILPLAVVVDERSTVPPPGEEKRREVGSLRQCLSQLSHRELDKGFAIEQRLDLGCLVVDVEEVDEAADPDAALAHLFIALPRLIALGRYCRTVISRALARGV